MRELLFTAYSAMALTGSALLVFNGERSHAAFILVMWGCITWGFRSITSRSVAQ